MPHISKQVNGILKIENEYLGESNRRDLIGNKIWFEAAMAKLQSGLELNPSAILFAQIDDEFVAKQVAKLGQNDENKNQKEKPNFEEITIEDFAKVKLRTAKVIEAEKVPKSKKLIKLLG